MSYASCNVVPGIQVHSNRQRITANSSIGIDFKDMVDHGIHGVPHGFKICNDRLEKREGPLAANAGQDNQTGVKLFGADKRAKITRILGDNDKSASDAPLQYTVVGGAAASEVQRVLGNVLAARIQFTSYLRGQALVNKQAHAAS